MEYIIAHEKSLRNDFPSLRHLRKFIGKRGKYGKHYFPVSNDGDERMYVSSSAVDRLISRYGADAPTSVLIGDISGNQEKTDVRNRPGQPDADDENRPEGESRPKGTDEVSDSDNDGSDDAAVHGGDGNSGEVDAPAETDSEEDRKGGDEDPQNEPDSPPGDSGPDSGNGGDRVSGDSGNTDGLGEQRQKAARTDTRDVDPVESDNLPSEMEAQDRDSKREDTPGKTDAERGDSPIPGEDSCSLSGDPSAKSEGENDDHSFSPTGDYGGDHSANAPPPKNYLKTKAAKECARWMEKIFRSWQVGVFGEESPRIDTKKLIREKYARRWNLNRCRRREMERRHILILDDVSGSCSGVCEETGAAAAHIMKNMENISKIHHSNGYLVWWSLHPDLAAILPDLESVRHDSLADIFDNPAILQKIAGVMAFGDWDAACEYRLFGENGANVIWLDSFGCSAYGVPPNCHRLDANPDSLPGNLPKSLLPIRATYIAGVGCAYQAAIALKIIWKSERRKNG